MVFALAAPKHLQSTIGLDLFPFRLHKNGFDLPTTFHPENFFAVVAREIFESEAEVAFFGKEQITGSTPVPSAQSGYWSIQRWLSQNPVGILELLQPHKRKGGVPF